jgi:hypothetical protein
MRPSVRLTNSVIDLNLFTDRFADMMKDQDADPEEVNALFIQVLKATREVAKWSLSPVLAILSSRAEGENSHQHSAAAHTYLNSVAEDALTLAGILGEEATSAVLREDKARAHASTPSGLSMKELLGVLKHARL